MKKHKEGRWYDTYNTNYIELCINDITKSAEAIEELKRIQRVSNYDKDVEAWGGYHKEILLNNILYLFEGLGFTLDDLKSMNEKEEIL